MEGGKGEEKERSSRLVEGGKGEEEERPSRFKPPALGTNPWLVYGTGKSRKQIFYDVFGGSYHLKSIPEMRNKLIWNCSYGWLILLDEKTLKSFTLLNPISMQNIKLPRMREIAPACVLLSRPLNDPNCYLMCFPMKKKCVVFCKVGDVEWTEQDLDLGLPPNDNGSLSCVGIYDGQVHMLRSQELFLVEIKDYNVTCTNLKVKRPSLPQRRNRAHRPDSMVESSGELFLIFRFSLGICGQLFEIIKLDSQKKVWVSVQNLNDRAIFANFCCAGPIASFSTKECPGLKDNTIYFTFPKDQSILYQYNFKEKRVAIYSCPNATQDWLPMWFFP
ncbi:hypothetical protein Tsubulata_024199 [Turnera subulata]|uniref:KIB1-4 beta-propeller domain-containing protein n=1 Tax=Turnera subulata TaxID=218843 RepID=A0A9Q0FVB3_9ROSI|nr:hypothetical protein Tsubulata_024199 [Turnera subulata]